MNTPRTFLAAVCAASFLAAAQAAENLVLRLVDDADHVRVPPSESLDFVDRFTWEAWIMADATPILGCAIIAKSRDGGGAGIRLGLTDFKPHLGVNDGAGFNLEIPSPDRIPALEWHHVAATYDGVLFKVYVDGELKTFANYPTLFRVSTSPLFIGSDAPEVTHIPGFLGALDEIRVWNRTLTQTEIQAQMHSILTGFESGLVGYWTFNDGTARDSSIRGNHGDFVAGATTEIGSEMVLQVFKAVEIVIPPVLPSRTVQVQYATTTTLPVWINLGDPVETEGQPFSIFDSVRGSERRFYRIVSQ